MRLKQACLLVAIGFAAASAAHAVPVIFSGTGPGAQTALADFQTASGPTPRRIGWDGVRLDGTDINPATQVLVPNTTVAIPENRFQGVGAIFAEPYAVAGDGFASVNPFSTGQFPAFSPANTFVMFDTDPGSFDDQFIEQSFVLAGTSTAAGTRGFGAIFLDVEQAGSSAIEYFGRDKGGNRVSLGRYDVPVAGNAGPSFLGVLFDDPIVADVVLTVGSQALFNVSGATVTPFGAENLPAGIDLVATDDFLFANPVALQTVPEPGTLALLLAAVGLAGMRRAPARSALLYR
jgi:hypothetical protein